MTARAGAAIPASAAFALLADAVAEGLPVPTSLAIDGDLLMIRFGTLDVGRRWLAHFGAEEARIAERIHLSSDGTLRRYLSHSALDQWHGWFLAVTAAEDLPVLVEASTDLVLAGR
jgi:hypothetical protein